MQNMKGEGSYHVQWCDTMIGIHTRWGRESPMKKSWDLLYKVLSKDWRLEYSKGSMKLARCSAHMKLINPMSAEWLPFVYMMSMHMTTSSGFSYLFCILQAIKKWRQGRSQNKAKTRQWEAGEWPWDAAMFTTHIRQQLTRFLDPLMPFRSPLRNISLSLRMRSLGKSHPPLVKLKHLV